MCPTCEFKERVRASKTNRSRHNTSYANRKDISKIALEEMTTRYNVDLLSQETHAWRRLPICIVFGCQPAARRLALTGTKTTLLSVMVDDGAKHVSAFFLR